MKRICLAVLTMAALIGPTVLGAQEAPPTDDPLFRGLFAPELVMQHRRAIDLTDEQRDAISRMIQDLQGRVVSIQWELMDDMESLTLILERPRVDLDRALDQFDTVLDQEKRVKQAHLELLIRIKNVLRPDQIETLERLRGAGQGA